MSYKQNDRNFRTVSVRRDTINTVRATLIAAAAVSLSWFAPATAAAERSDACQAVVDSVKVQVLFPIGKSNIDLGF